jgi:hypothetical protein
MTLTGKQVTIFFIDDPMMKDVPKFNRVKKFPLTWHTDHMGKAYSIQECNILKEKYPNADIRVAQFSGEYKVRVVFENEADEAEFIMRESL